MGMPGRAGSQSQGKGQGGVSQSHEAQTAVRSALRSPVGLNSTQEEAQEWRVSNRAVGEGGWGSEHGEEREVKTWIHNSVQKSGS